jgi:glycosyltransferase involved in cell wall biosynthesis
MIPAATVLPEGSYHPNPRQGAIQTGVEEATKRFKKYSPYIFSSYMKEKPAEELIDGVRQYRIKTDTLDKLLFPFYALKSPYYCYAYKTAQKIKELGIKIVHVRNRPLYMPFLRSVLGNNVKLVLHEHNQNIADTLSQAEANEVLASVDAYVAVSRFTYNFEIAERYPRYKDKSYVILNGVNLDKFRPFWEQEEKAQTLRKKYGIEGSKVVLFSGALRERKGIHFLIDAFKLVAAKHPDARLVIAGGDKDNLEAKDKYAMQLKESAASLGNKVIFTGFIPQTEASDIYLLGDIFCGPSLWDEAFGLVFAEASATGLAVIGSKRGGIPEIIQDGKTGLLINKPEDPDEIAQKIIALMESPSDSRRFGEAARRYMEEKFSWERVANEIESLYDRLLK